jgi:thiaminase/transcriptional activator TenA
MRTINPSSFSTQAWERNVPAYEAIRTMPFNTELAAGVLDRARFKHYITQDAHYLIGFGRALALAAAKAPQPDRIVQFAKAAEVAIVVERALHGSFFAQFGITPQVFAETPLSPACHHYVSYLLAAAYAEPYEVVLGALLPCFWIYAEVGRDIHGRAAPSNPYQAWIDTYAGEEFHIAVRAILRPRTKPPTRLRQPCAIACTPLTHERPSLSGRSGILPIGWRLGPFRRRSTRAGREAVGRLCSSRAPIRVAASRHGC